MISDRVGVASDGLRGSDVRLEDDDVGRRLAELLRGEVAQGVVLLLVHVLAHAFQELVELIPAVEVSALRA